MHSWCGVVCCVHADGLMLVLVKKVSEHEATHLAALGHFKWSAFVCACCCFVRFCSVILFGLSFLGFAAPFSRACLRKLNSCALLRSVFCVRRNSLSWSLVRLCVSVFFAFVPQHLNTLSCWVSRFCFLAFAVSIQTHSHSRTRDSRVHPHFS